MQPVDPRIAAQRPTGCCSARLLGCGTRSPLYLIGDAASRRGLSRVWYFITLNGSLNGHPPSCVLCAVLWVGGVNAYNVGIPLLVCACYVGTHVGVLHAGCLNDN